ncbi:MAG: gamma carbonic anhydrase family protein [Myxococcota bacterium]
MNPVDRERLGARPLNYSPYRGRWPSVADGAYVAPSASLVGDVTIGTESSIWFGAVLRGDVQPIRVGERTSIQDNAIVHATEGWAPTVVGNDVTVGHGVILHGCQIGDLVLIGMGTIILDEASVGARSMIGAGSLVTARSKIPEGVLAFGRPAKPVRDLRPDELKRLEESSQIYVRHAGEYLAESVTR